MYLKTDKQLLSVHISIEGSERVIFYLIIWMTKKNIISKVIFLKAVIWYYLAFFPRNKQRGSLVISLLTCCGQWTKVHVQGTMLCHHLTPSVQIFVETLFFLDGTMLYKKHTCVAEMCSQVFFGVVIYLFLNYY